MAVAYVALDEAAVHPEHDSVDAILAVNAVRGNTRMSTNAASCIFGVPRTTLRRIMNIQCDGGVATLAAASAAAAHVAVLCSIDVHGDVQLYIVSVLRTTVEGIGCISSEPVLLPRSRGGQMRLTRIEERALTDYLLQRSDMALPMTPAAAGAKAKEIVHNRGGTAFNTSTQTPGRHFWRGFRRRNPEIGGRKPQPLPPAKAALSISAVDAFFSQLRDVAQRVSVSVRSSARPVPLVVGLSFMCVVTELVECR